MADDAFRQDSRFEHGRSPTWDRAGSPVSVIATENIATRRDSGPSDRWNRRSPATRPQPVYDRSCAGDTHKTQRPQCRSNRARNAACRYRVLQTSSPSRRHDDCRNQDRQRIILRRSVFHISHTKKSSLLHRTEHLESTDGIGQAAVKCHGDRSPQDDVAIRVERRASNFRAE
jgi:hypothetical protein